ncbi:MAG: DeoR family transcriptional regulator, partial [Hyphomicrobiales bacterium]|nr:DeoR family transcriptional regulator [Hyphomicrobiales bacterium]
MRERERMETLERLIAERGFLSVADMQAATGASPASVRRDAQKLADAGRARRVHGGLRATGGGAGLRAPALATRAFDVSATINV